MHESLGVFETRVLLVYQNTKDLQISSLFVFRDWFFCSMD